MHVLKIHLRYWSKYELIWEKWSLRIRRMLFVACYLSHDICLTVITAHWNISTRNWSGESVKQSPVEDVEAPNQTRVLRLPSMSFSKARSFLVLYMKPLPNPKSYPCAFLSVNCIRFHTICKTPMKCQMPFLTAFGTNQFALGQMARQDVSLELRILSLVLPHTQTSCKKRK